MTADFLKRMLLLSLVLVVPTAGYAQEATFTGAVTDSTGAGADLPHATVTAVHEASGNTLMTVTDGRGEFRLPVRIESFRTWPATSATTVSTPQTSSEAQSSRIRTNK